jgi:hypothetical protein
VMCNSRPTTGSINRILKGDDQMDLLSKASTGATLTFVVSSMLAMGAGLAVEQIVDALRSRRMILSALLGNFVLMPLAALALTKLLALDQALSVVCCCSAVRLAHRSCQNSLNSPRVLCRLLSARWSC